MEKIMIRNGLKLNVRRTLLVGLAFFAVSMFWQVYDNIMPLFLLDFNFTATERGIIMALDNVLAVVLLPFMGILSDNFPQKWRSKFGRRMPFIVVGSVLGAITFMLVNFAHNQLNLVLMLVTTAFVLLCMCFYRTPAVALMPDVTVKPLRSKANAIINLTGTLGGILVLVLGMIFATSKNHYMEYTGYVLAVCAIMLTGLIVFISLGNQLH